MFAMQLVMFLEKTFTVTIEPQDLLLDNFRTVDAMARLIEAKARGATA
jgi:methoxymalonate biosynthesis acyl carrier protein